MSNIEKIGKFEVIALFIAVITNNIILNIPTILLEFSGTGVWINIIYVTFICIIFILLICKFFKPFISSDILDVSKFLGGNILKYIVAILYIILFLSICIMCLRYFLNSLQIIYFNETPLLFLFLLLLIPIIIASKNGLKAISGANLVFIPISIIAIIILLFAASKDFVWERLFPALGYGPKKIFLNQITNIFAFTVVPYLYFIKPFLKQDKDFTKISIFSVILCGLYLFLTLLSLLMSFAFITQTDENLSLYLLTRLIDFGRFIQRFDAIFIFIWILTLLSFLSFNLFLLTHIIKKMLNLKSASELVYPLSSLILGCSFLFKDITTLKFFARNIYRLYNFILVFIISLIIFLLAYFKKKKQGVIANESKK